MLELRILAEGKSALPGIFHPVALTILFIFLSTIVAAFIRGRKRDKCLKAFRGFMVTLEDVKGKRIWGRLRVENTGIELMYPQKHADADGHIESSYMLYKYEFGNVQAMIRFHDQLSEENVKKREAELKRTYHPSCWRRWRRKLMNIFRTIRDSIMEVSNVLMSQAKKATPAGSLLSTQDKYVSRMKNELIGSVETSYEPLLERYIGHRVVAEFLRGETLVEVPGVLKDYTAEFIELLDVQYWDADGITFKKADIIIPRKRTAIRHLAE